MTGIIKNKKKWEILAESLSNIPYGDVVKHEQISDIIGEKYGSSNYNMIVHQAKKLLLREYKISFESIRGIGYRRIKADDFTKQAIDHFRRGANDFRKGAETLEFSPVNDMSEEGRAEYRHISDRTRQLEAALIGGLTEVRVLREKRHPFLPENMNRR